MACLDEPCLGDPLAENARLKRELAKVHHRQVNRDEAHKQEIEFWRRCALNMELRLAEGQMELQGFSSDPEAETDDDSGHHEEGPLPSAEELSRLRAMRINAEQKNELLRAHVQDIERGIAEETSLSQHLRERACQQAVGFLTRRASTPAQTFVASLARLDEQTLRWVREQIDQDVWVQVQVESCVAAKTSPSRLSYVRSSASRPVADRTGVSKRWGPSVGEKTASVPAVGISSAASLGDRGPCQSAHTAVNGSIDHAVPELHGDTVQSPASQQDTRIPRSSGSGRGGGSSARQRGGKYRDSWTSSEAGGQQKRGEASWRIRK